MKMVEGEDPPCRRSTQPKNGIKTFFTEETFTKWMGHDTHESRMEERLSKLGLSLSSKLTGPFFLTTPKVESKGHQKIDMGTRCSQFSIKTESDTVTADKEPSEVKRESPTQRSLVNVSNIEKIEMVESFEKPDQQQQHLGTNLAEGTEKIDYASQPVVHVGAKVHVDDTEGICAKTWDTGANSELLEIQGRNNTTEQKEMTISNVNDKYVTEEAGLEMQEFTASVVDSKDVDTEFVRPFSFYKEGSDEKLQSESVEKEHTITTNEEQLRDNETRGQTNFKRTRSDSIKIARQMEPEQLSSEVLGPEKSEECRKEAEEVQDEEARKAQKQLLVQDKMFFNLKDRTAEKYFPDVFKKRPRNRRSKLTCQEQKLYIDLVRRFGNVNSNSAEIHDENFKKYLEMKVTVSKEQELFQNYLKSISHTCKKDYAYIHPEVEKYVTARYLVKKKECFKYPRFYNTVKKIVLTDAVPDSPPTLQYVRPLLELGSVSKLVLPSVLPGMPQPCVSTSFKKINDICPIVKGVYSGTYVWNKVVCSQDSNAEQLAVPNKCDFVMSSSAIKRLADNQGRIFKYWDMPFTVREYKINEGEKTTIHKVIYIDKPIIRQSQFVPKEHIQLYQKHAIRACAIRNNVRGQVFCGIKPVHELVKMPTLEEIQHEMNDYEGKLKETVNKDSVLELDSEDEVTGSKVLRKRKRKHGQVGVFDLEQDIDDLETFGMDSFLVPKGKTDDDITAPTCSDKLKSPNKETDTFGKVVKKGRKSAQEDLESLKNELECIKSRAIKESFKQAEMLKDTYSKGNEKRTEDAINSNNEEKHDEVNTEKHREEENDTKSVMQNEENSNEILDGSADSRKDKKDILTVKSISSLSEKMKQMSTIKSKLMHKMKGQDLTSHTPASDIPGVAQLDISDDRIGSNKFRGDIQSVTNSNTVNNLEEIKVDEVEPEQKFNETASDTDSEGEGLVIDVSYESPAVSAARMKPSVRNNDKILEETQEIAEMPTLEKLGNDVSNKVPTSEKIEAELENVCDNNKTVRAESKEVDTSCLVIAAGESEKTAGKEMKVGKRRNTTEVAEDVSMPKRILRSSANSRASSLTTRSNQSAGQMSDAVNSASLSDNSKDKSCGTRNKSSSSDNGGQPTEPSAINQAGDSKGEIGTASVPVKRGRGRPRKNMQRIVSCNQSSAEIPNDIKNNKKSKDQALVETEEHTMQEDEEHLDNRDPDLDTNCDEKIPHLRRRSNVRRIDSDDEMEEDSSVTGDERHQGHSNSVTTKKELSKDMSDIEARKIKEMAEAMKKRIEETKKKLQEEKCLKRRQSEESEERKSNETVLNMPEDSKKMDHPQDAVDVGLKSSHTRKVDLKSEEKSNVERGLDEGLERILKLQDKMQEPCANKGSLAEVFTQKHGMTHCGFPMDDNVTYHQWNLSGINVLIRSKYHGFISGQGFVHISPKVEYQPNFGFEQDSVNEICKNWMSVFIRPNSTLLKPRINPFNSEIMMFENIAYKDLVPPDCLFKPAQAFTDLHVILDKLKSLPVGQYLLKNNPRKDQFSVLKAAEPEERGMFDLHLHHSSLIKSNSPPSIQWTPLDTTLMLPHQRKMNYIPCTYQPKDAKIGEKKQEKSKKKKKRKNKDK